GRDGGDPGAARRAARRAGRRRAARGGHGDAGLHPPAAGAAGAARAPPARVLRDVLAGRRALRRLPRAPRRLSARRRSARRDVAELVRGKTGRVFGNLMALLTVVKGLPLAYNRDLQEDKEPIFDTCDTLRLCLDATARMLPALRFDRERMARATERGFLTAT